MNLQEQIGNYLLLKQLEQQAEFEVYIASKVNADHEVETPTGHVMEGISLLEVLCLSRHEHTNDELDDLLHSKWDRRELASQQGWSQIDDIESKTRSNHLIQPVFSRPFTDGVTLGSLLKTMRQKNRRFPLPQALKLSRFILNTTVSLPMQLLSSTEQLEKIIHVGYQGHLTVKSNALTQNLMGHTDQQALTEALDPLRDLATLLISLTCDVHLSGPSSSPQGGQGSSLIEERFQGPAPVKEQLIHLIDALSRLSSTDVERMAELKELSSSLEQAILESSLDCPPILIETFLNSVYPFESAQAKRELNQLKQRSAEALLPSNNRLRLSTIEDFLDGDEHTQTTLTIIPKIAPTVVHEYDALSTDSSSESEDDLNVDIDQDQLSLTPDLLDEKNPLPTLDQEDLSDPTVGKESEIQSPDTESRPRGLLSPRPSDLKSLEAQARRERGRQLNTIELLGPIDDFDSIDLSGVQSDNLRSLVSEVASTKEANDSRPDEFEVSSQSTQRSIKEPDKNTQKANSFAGSFKYPEGYRPSEAKVSTAQNATPGLTQSSKSTGEDTSKDQSSERQIGKPISAKQNFEFNSPIPEKAKRDSAPLLGAAVLAILTAFGSNYLADYIFKTQGSTDSQREVLTSLKSEETGLDAIDPTPSENTNTEEKSPSAPALQDKTEQNKESSSQSSQTKGLRLITVSPKPTMIRRGQDTFSLSSIDELNLEGEELNELLHLYAPGYIPLSMPLSELVMNGPDEDRILHLTPGDHPMFALNLKVAPKGKGISVRANGLLLSSDSKIELPMGILSQLEIEREGYQSHHLLIKPTAKSISQQDVFLKRANRAKPILTLRSSIGSAQLFLRELGQAESQSKKLEKGLSRFEYKPNESLELTAESPVGLHETWRFTPVMTDVLPAYTVRLEMNTQGEGELQFKGGHKLKAIFTPIKPSEQSASDLKAYEEPKLNKRIKLAAGTYRVSLINRKTDQQVALYNVDVYTGYRSEWQLKEVKQKITIDGSQTKQSATLWRADFKRYHQLK